MLTRLPLTRLLLLLPLLLASCSAPEVASSSPTSAKGPSGTLILIGGGLERDNEPVYRRMLELAKHPTTGKPNILIATAASLDEKSAAENATAAFRRYDPSATIAAISRDTPTADAVAVIDAAHLVFFTGGDQKRIVDLYRPAGIDKPEAAALRSLLARSGTIAGTSAGLAMMSDPMFLTGSSDDALENGPKIGPGMGFIKEVITDSHFVERARLGRLVTALAVANRRIGVGLAENAAAEYSLESGTLTSLTPAPAVTVDTALAIRQSRAISAILARSMTTGEALNLSKLASPARFDRSTLTTATLESRVANKAPAKRHAHAAFARPDGWLEIDLILSTEQAPPPLVDEKPEPAVR